MLYYRLCKGKTDYGKFVPVTEDVSKHINTFNEFYTSAGLYNEEHKKTFEATKSVAGFSGVVFKQLFFDLDSTDFETARKDTLTICNRLREAGVGKESVGIYFSGKKGFHITVALDEAYFLPQIKATAIKLLEGCSSADVVVYNENRIFRVDGSRHQATGLYKTELSFTELSEFTEFQVRDKAKLRHQAVPKTPCSFKLEIAPASKTTEEKTLSLNISEIDWSRRPKFLTKARYALQQGFFNGGERHTAMLCLASTYKNMGFELDHTYRILKGVASLQAKRTGTERFPDEEIWNSVCTSVYSTTWKGGQFSEREEGNWLNLYAKRLGLIEAEHQEELSVDSTKAFQLFKSYAKNYKDNIIHTGIDELDKHCKFLVGTSNAIVAAPGTGKSSLMFTILNSTSLKGVPSVCFSLDMFHSLLSMRLAQKHTGLSQEKIYEIAEKDGERFKMLEKEIQHNYENVRFCFKAGITIDEIVETIKDAEEQIGKKIKLVFIDYNELVISDKSDPTAASADVIQAFRRIANELEVCIVTLLQPSKAFSSPSEEITNFNAAKGSSAIAQSVTLLLGINRPGYNVMDPSTDRYLSITGLKNRNGPNFQIDCSWEGLRGSIGTLDDQQRQELFEIRRKRDEAKKGSSSGSWS